MSKLVYEGDNVRGSSYCGPVRADGANRRRFQVELTGDFPLNTMSIEEASALASALSLACVGAFMMDGES